MHVRTERGANPKKDQVEFQAEMTETPRQIEASLTPKENQILLYGIVNISMSEPKQWDNSSQTKSNSNQVPSLQMMFPKMLYADL